MSDIIDKAEINHELNLLIKPGIANTELVTREYQFTEDNIIDALADHACGSIGTKTITPLPSNAVAMHCFIGVSRPGNPPFINGKRTVGGATVEWEILAGTAYVGGIYWIPTNGNQFYIAQIGGTVSKFRILGYKVKE